MSIALPQEEQTATRPLCAKSKPVSEARLRANRLNAKKSTGPRSNQGKARSAQNAHRHGLCSESALLPGECQATYNIFEAELKEELRPRTALQHTLFPDLARLIWKMRRLPDAERQLFQTESQSPDQLPCSILAQAFHEEPTRNPFLLFNRYEVSTRNALLRLLRMYYYLQKHHPTTPTDPDEPAVPHERASPRNQPNPTHPQEDKTPPAPPPPHPTPPPNPTPRHRPTP